VRVCVFARIGIYMTCRAVRRGKLAWSMEQPGLLSDSGQAQLLFDGRHGHTPLRFCAMLAGPECI
jgi:hypothetical protein